MRRVVVLILGLLVAVGCAGTPAEETARAGEPGASGGGDMAPPPEPAAVHGNYFPPAGTPVEQEDSGKGSGKLGAGGAEQAPDSGSKPADGGPRGRAFRPEGRPAPVASPAAEIREAATGPVTAIAPERNEERPLGERASGAGVGKATVVEVAESDDPEGVGTAVLVVPPSVVPPAAVPEGMSRPASRQERAAPPAWDIPGREGEPAQVAAPDLPSAPGQPVGVLPAGTVLEIRLSERLSTETQRTGDRFRAVLDQDVELTGGGVIPRGSILEGEVTEAEAPGKVKGKARLSITLVRLMIDGRAFGLRTNEISLEAEGSAKQDLKQVGIGAAVGTALGAIFGGKKGAAVGAAAGAGAGTAKVLTTRGNHVEVLRERLFSFRLEEPVEVAGR